MSSKLNSKLETEGASGLRIAPRPAPSPPREDEAEAFLSQQSYEGHSDDAVPPEPKKDRKKAKAKKGKRRPPTSNPKADADNNGVHFVIPRSVHKRLKLICLIQGTTMSDVVADLVADYVERHKGVLDLGE